MKKDYYKILDLSEDEKKLQGDEFKKIVKNKFRALSRKYHPDKCKDESKKTEYEEKFKEIAEAYSVLSDDEKRQQYDNPSSMGGDFGGFGNFNMDDILREFGFGGFGGFNYGQAQRTQKGKGMRMVLSVSLEDIFNGVEKTLKYKRYEVCKECKGSGKSSRSVEERCTHCGGTGQIIQHVGPWQQISTCPHCNGKGTILKNPCPNCKGEGIELTEHNVTFTIPKGVGNGYMIMLNGEGNAPSHGKGEFGDLQIILKENDHDKFIREGNDLYFELEVSVIDAILGCQKEIETIDGKTLLTNIPPCSENGTKIRFGGKGMPIYNTSRFGDMYGIITIKMPKTLTEREKELLGELKRETNFHD